MRKIDQMKAIIDSQDRTPGKPAHFWPKIEAIIKSDKSNLYLDCADDYVEFVFDLTGEYLLGIRNYKE